LEEKKLEIKSQVFSYLLKLFFPIINLFSPKTNLFSTTSGNMTLKTYSTSVEKIPKGG